MSNEDLKKNLDKMAADGYFQEDLKVQAGTFSLEDFQEDKLLKEKHESKKGNRKKGANKTNKGGVQGKTDSTRANKKKTKKGKDTKGGTT